MKAQPHSKDLSTVERLATTARAVAQGVGLSARKSHETIEAENERLTVAQAERIIERWPDPQRNVARQMLEAYGAPNEATPTKLFWVHNGPWKRTMIQADSVVHQWPTVHTDFLTQTIDYRVPPERISDIAEWDGSVTVDRTRGELSARCDSEAANILAMNMAHEIATGKRTVAEAREASEQNTVAYNLGRDAPYTTRLLFDVPDGGTEDLDSSRISAAITQQGLARAADIVTGQNREPTDRRSGD